MKKPFYRCPCLFREIIANKCLISESKDISFKTEIGSHATSESNCKEQLDAMTFNSEALGCCLITDESKAEAASCFA